MYKILKRFFDIIISLLGLIVTLPLLILVAILIKLDSKGPIIFKQERLGKEGKIFRMLKFRSMVVGAEKGGVYEAEKDPRVTRIGRIIRKLSIDELPQFFNILKGDMSIIGPRPVLTYHPWSFNKYSEYQKQRFKVRPGVTGWAQVNGRKNVEWNERIALDIHYVNNLSLWFDIKIFLKTIIKVFSMKDNFNQGITASNKLTLMYITNNPKVAKIADENGVDWIFIDLEINGKVERQGHLDTVISHHKVCDIKEVKSVLNNSKILVRINPIYDGSKEEIETVIKQGADIIMLPFFKTDDEVELFIKFVNKKAKVCLLLETPEAVEKLDEILKIDGIDYIHIGLNDLHLGYKKQFMFELLVDGTVDSIIEKIKATNIKYGFGGIARIGTGELPAEKILAEHYRLGSSMVILSRQFCNVSEIADLDKINNIFKDGIQDIRNLEKILETKSKHFFEENHDEVKKVTTIIRKKKLGEQ